MERSKKSVNLKKKTFILLIICNLIELLKEIIAYTIIVIKHNLLIKDLLFLKRVFDLPAYKNEKLKDFAVNISYTVFLKTFYEDYNQVVEKNIEQIKNIL